MTTTLEIVIANELREQDAEADVVALAAKHGVALDGEYPAYRLNGEFDGVRPKAQGGLDTAVQALLVDLVYAAAIKNVTIGWHAGRVMPDTAPLARMQIDELIAASRAGSLELRVWYRVHAPASYRCRPRSFR